MSELKTGAGCNLNFMLKSFPVPVASICKRDNFLLSASQF